MRMQGSRIGTQAAVNPQPSGQSKQPLPAACLLPKLSIKAAYGSSHAAGVYVPMPLSVPKLPSRRSSHSPLPPPLTG